MWQSIVDPIDPVVSPNGSRRALVGVRQQSQHCCCCPWRVWPWFLYRLDPHAGHASLMRMTAVGLSVFGSGFDQQEQEPSREHALCRTTGFDPRAILLDDIVDKER